MSEVATSASGVLASTEPLLYPDAYMKNGRRNRTLGYVELDLGRRRESERFLRAALEDFVNAFLVDRIGHRDSFTEAHQLGREISKTFGCPMKRGATENVWQSNCGIAALHNRVGLSIGGQSWGHCSICEANDFECSHVPGYAHDGVVCVRVIHRMQLDEVSVVQFPDDPRCYRLFLDRSLSEIESDLGHALPNGATPSCIHCETCSSTKMGPTEEDIDQSLWPPFEPPQTE